jgi:hypothetical protein
MANCVDIDKNIINTLVIKTKQNKSDIWTYFGELISEDNGKVFDKNYHYCKICFNAEPKILSK